MAEKIFNEGRESKNPLLEIKQILENTVDQYPITPEQVLQLETTFRQLGEALQIIKNAEKQTAENPGQRPAWFVDLLKSLEGLNFDRSITGPMSNYEQAVRQIKQLVDKS